MNTPMNTVSTEPLPTTANGNEAPDLTPADAIEREIYRKLAALERGEIAGFVSVQVDRDPDVGRALTVTVVPGVPLSGEDSRRLQNLLWEAAQVLREAHDAA